jgi:hypothetical protein
MRRTEKVCPADDGYSAFGGLLGEGGITPAKKQYFFESFLLAKLGA